MAVVKQIAGTRTSLTSTNLGTLGSGAFCTSATKDNTANQPIDVMVEVTVATTNTPSGNKQLIVYAIASYDNSAFQSGPTSGTSTGDAADLTLLGVVPMVSITTTHRKSFAVAPSYGGVLPPYFQVVTMNDLGVAITSGSINTSEISVTVA